MSNLRVFTEDELKEVLSKHSAWLECEDNGERADLSSADLRSANLDSANLSFANLSYANLSSANLSSANLRSADLRFADLSSANLSSAGLSSADLSYADLRYANLSFAELSDANLILIGQDVRGYLFYGFKNEDGVLVLRAGCRQFIGISEARSHWEGRHGDEILSEDCLSLVDRAARMAKVRGWKLEV